MKEFKLKTILQFNLIPDKTIAASENPRAIAVLNIPQSAIPLKIDVVAAVDDWPALWVEVDTEDFSPNESRMIERRFEMLVDGEEFDPDTHRYRATVSCSNGERVLHVMELKGR
jgi:hypothetical protein